MYSQELERLIWLAIDSTNSNWGISDKDKEILHKRAAQENVDIDELDMYVDKLFKNKKENRKYDLIKDIEYLGKEYEKEDLESIDKDAFVKLFQLYWEHHRVYSDGEETNEIALAALRTMHSFCVPTDKERLDMFCKSLETNEQNFKEICNQEKSHLAEKAYKEIIDKTNNAYDECYRDYQRPITEKEKKILDDIECLEKSGNPDAILDIVKYYSGYSEIGKWGSKKGVEMNPVCNVILSAINKFEIPTDKDVLTVFMKAVIMRREELKQLSASYAPLKIKNGLFNKDLYDYFIDKGDDVIKKYYPNETEGFIGERLSQKAKLKKYIICACIAAFIIMILAELTK